MDGGEAARVRTDFLAEHNRSRLSLSLAKIPPGFDAITM